MMRFLRVVLALIVGLVLAGPETHACPVHDGMPPAAHHHDGGQHQKAAQCTCPQACCPVTSSASVPPPAATWTPADLPIRVAQIAATHVVGLSPREHLQPFALAPPLAHA